MPGREEADKSLGLVLTMCWCRFRCEGREEKYRASTMGSWSN